MKNTLVVLLVVSSMVMCLFVGFHAGRNSEQAALDRSAKMELEAMRIKLQEQEEHTSNVYRLYLEQYQTLAWWRKEYGHK